MQMSVGEQVPNARQSVPPVTWLGLILAFFGAPALIFIFNKVVGDRPLNDSLVYIRETAIFALAALLLLLVTKGEKLGLASIGLHNRRWGRSIVVALIGLVACIAAAAVTLLIFQWVGIQFGSGSESKRYGNVSLWAITYMILRAGSVEEICYRGYLMERLHKISGGNWFVYFLLPLVLFAAWHYRQGIGGIIISFVLGTVLALMYWKERDLKANIITHFLGDFIPNVLLPLISP